MILVTGLVLMIVGGCVLASGLRGRLLNAHPHCRGCGFDLHGIELASGTRCPECGRLISTSGSSVRIGRRKKSPAVVVLGVLLTLIGTGGVSYPLWSQIPAWKNINWYEHLPESLVIDMATRGNTKALDVFHDRLIPGEVSDTVLLTLVEHAITLLDDESIVWDERWGNILLYAFIMEKLPDDVLFEIMERSNEVHAYIHQEIDTEMERVSVWLDIDSSSNGKSDPNFRMELARLLVPGDTFPELPTPYQLRIETGIPFGPGPRERGRFSGAIGEIDPNRAGWWLPFSGANNGVGSEMRVSKDLAEFEAHFEARFLMYKGDELVHEWTESIIKQVRRVPEPNYIERVAYSSELEPVIRSITVQAVTVPTRLDDARKHDQIMNGQTMTLNVNTSIDEDMGLLGELWFDNGESTLKFKALKIPKLQGNHSHGVAAPHKFNQLGQTWLDWFDRNSAFWDIAIENGSVDVIYMPEPNLAATDPRMTRMIDVPIVFNDVQIRTQVPRQREVHIGRNGPTELQWGMEDVNQPEVGVSYTTEEYQRRFAHPEPVAGEVYNEANHKESP